MKKSRNISSRIIALFFLAAFVSAIGKSISCDYGNIPFLAHNEGTDDHGHNHGDLHHHHPHMHTSPDQADHDHEHEGSTNDESDNCCKKLAKTLYSSFSKRENNKLQIPDYSAATVVHIEPLFNIVITVKTADHYSWKAPPPKIPDIRVFIQSFII